jgi:hypothetical protein
VKQVFASSNRRAKRHRLIQVAFDDFTLQTFEITAIAFWPSKNADVIPREKKLTENRRSHKPRRAGE